MENKTINFNIKDNLKVLRIIGKALKSNSSSYVTFERYASYLYIYSESGITGMRLIYKISLDEDWFDFDDLFNLENTDIVENSKSLQSFTVNITFIESLILLKSAEEIIIEYNDKVVTLKTLDGNTKISFSNLNPNVSLDDFDKLLTLEIKDTLDVKIINVMSKSLLSLKEDAYKKYIAIERNYYYTSNNSFIIEMKSNYRSSEPHTLTYIMLDTIKMIPIEDSNFPLIHTDEYYTIIKYGDLIIQFDNLGVERFERLLDLVNINSYEPLLTIHYEELEKIKLLSLGGTVEDYDEVTNHIININTKDKQALCTKGTYNTAYLNAHVGSEHKISVNYFNLLKAVFLAGSKSVSLLVDKNSQQETLIIQGSNTKVLISLEEISKPN